MTRRDVLAASAASVAAPGVVAAAASAEPNPAEANKAAVKAFYDLIYQGDFAGALDRYATPDIEWIVAVPDNPETNAYLPWVGTVHRGRAGVLRMNDLLFGSFDVISFDIDESLAEGDIVALFGRFVFRNKATGKLAPTDWAARLTMRDGRIARGQFFENTLAVASASRHGGSWDVENVGLRRTVG